MVSEYISETIYPKQQQIDNLEYAENIQELHFIEEEILVNNYAMENGWYVSTLHFYSL